MPTTYTVREVARILKVCPNMVHKLAKNGALKNKRVGDLYRFTAETLRAYLGLSATAEIIVPPDRELVRKQRQRTAARKKRKQRKRH